MSPLARLNDSVGRFNFFKRLIRISEWFKCNRLTLHLNKTRYSIFHGPKKKISRMYDKMSIDGHIFLREYKVKYLGLMIDKTLSWRGHVEYI